MRGVVGPGFEPDGTAQHTDANYRAAAAVQSIPAVGVVITAQHGGIRALVQRPLLFVVCQRCLPEGAAARDRRCQ